ncbi:OprO/OprP family phosphate-selective porin [Corallococcus exiguus]|uniref:OprO/OprP family phosphate-selective porin n=1 Tax=Corallococcus exiguus TaxID=83462 RepID=UPI0020162101|nr:OprO/OprP family phosphate-selective porin [Corallococcus exiguus]
MKSASLFTLALLASGTALAQEENYPRFTPTFVAEVDYRVHADDIEGHNGFNLARLRLGGRGQPVPWLVAVGTAEWAQEKPALLDAYVDLLVIDGLRFSVGYAKTPLFPAGRDQSIETLPIPELPLVTAAFWARRDLGAEVQWTPASLPLEGWLRLGNGSGSPLGNDNAQPSVDVRLDVRHSGVRVGAGAHVEDAFDRPGIGGRGAQNFLFYRPPPVSGYRTVTEAHGRLDAGPVRVDVQAAAAWEHRSRDTDGNPATPRESLPSMSSQGLGVEASWVIRGMPRKGARWPEPLAGVGSEGIPSGSLELAARVERLWLGRGAPDVVPGGTTGGALAFHWWVTRFLGFGVAGYVNHYDTPPVEMPTRDWSYLALLRTTVSLQ